MSESPFPSKSDAVNPAASSEIGIARVDHHLELTEEADADAFERLMLGQIFASVNTQDEGSGPETSDVHALLGTADFGRSYVWEIRMFYPMHQTATPVWLLRRAPASYEQAKAQIEEFATLVDTDIHFDVREWRQLRGLDMA